MKYLQERCRQIVPVAKNFSDGGVVNWPRPVVFGRQQGVRLGLALGHERVWRAVVCFSCCQGGPYGAGDMYLRGQVRTSTCTAVCLGTRYQEFTRSDVTRRSTAV